MYKHFVKRGLDFLLSLCGIIVLSPVLAALWVLVRVKLGSPVLFKQERPGKGERIFTLCKFRTMTDEKDAQGNLLPRLILFPCGYTNISIDRIFHVITPFFDLIYQVSVNLHQKSGILAIEITSKTNVVYYSFLIGKYI